MGVKKEAKRKTNAEERELIQKQKAEARETEMRCKADLKLANKKNCSSRRRYA